MSQRAARVALAFLCALGTLGVLGPRDANAQLKRPRAEVAPLVGSDGRVALRVSLPEGLHTQSNKPRDPLLIPTELTIDAPSGIVVKEVVFPPSTDLKQAGQGPALAGFAQTLGNGVPPARPPEAKHAAGAL